MKGQWFRHVQCVQPTGIRAELADSLLVQLDSSFGDVNVPWDVANPPSASACFSAAGVCASFQKGSVLTVFKSVAGVEEMALDQRPGRVHCISEEHQRDGDRASAGLVAETGVCPRGREGEENLGSQGTHGGWLTVGAPSNATGCLFDEAGTELLIKEKLNHYYIF